jgi:hypothetical protein
MSFSYNRSGAAQRLFADHRTLHIDRISDAAVQTSESGRRLISAICYQNTIFRRDPSLFAFPFEQTSFDVIETHNFRRSEFLSQSPESLFRLADASPVRGDIPIGSLLLWLAPGRFHRRSSSNR